MQMLRADRDISTVETEAASEKGSFVMGTSTVTTARTSSTATELPPAFYRSTHMQLMHSAVYNVKTCLSVCLRHTHIMHRNY